MKEFELKYGCNPNQKPSKIYMANGNDLAKSTAKYVTDTNDNFGVAKAINKYVFGE